MEGKTFPITYRDDDCWFGDYKESDLVPVGLVVNGVFMYALTPDGKYYVTDPIPSHHFLIDTGEQYIYNPAYQSLTFTCKFYPTK